MRQIFEEIHRVTTMVPSIPDGESSAPGLSMDLVTLAHGLFSAHTPKIKLLSKGRVVLSLCSSQHWAAKAPPFKVELRLNPSQSKAATDTGSSRNATTPFCEVAKFQRNNVSTKKTQRQIDSQNNWQSVYKSRPREDGRGCAPSNVIATLIRRHFNCLRGPPVVGTPNASNKGI
jgi:hypothetical protein